MSYDIQAYRLPADRSGIDVLRAGDAEEHALVLAVAERERLAAALHAVEPSAERVDGDDFIEIYSDAVQVFVYESVVEINVPYHGGEAPIEGAFAYAAVLTAHGLTVWDPQAESIVTGDDGAKRAAMDSFAATSGVAREILDEDPRTPGWKFWKR